MHRIIGSFILLLLVYSSANAQQNVLQGKITNGITMKKVSFAIVIIQEAGLVINAPQGIYSVAFQKQGKYTVKVQSEGLQSITTVIEINGVVTKDFILNPSSKGGIVIKGERDVQTISRQTMTVKEIKGVPASFGDSLNALTSLPGVNRADIFGPMVIRGADSATNGYYIDDIPIYKPMHFGGLHSVINNDLMSEVDLYASAFPSQFSNAQSAVININTIDEVKESGGNADVGLISSNALIKAPITRKVIVDGKEVEENAGYVIAAGRYGYLSLFIPFIYKHMLGKDLDWLPQYWDYQFKIKYKFNEKNSVTFLAFGSRDYIDLVLKDNLMDPGSDPAMLNATIYQNEQAHSQGLYYTYKYSEQLSNTVIAYSALNQSKQWYNFPESTNSALKDLGITSNPYIFGVKDKLKLEWWKSHGELRTGVEATYYDFKVSGKTISVNSASGNSDSIDTVPLSDATNKTITWYTENKFIVGGLTFVPGVHSEYLARTNCTTMDPRGMASYLFPTNTTIGIAGGYYSQFIQTNPTYFTMFPNLAGDDYLKPQRSIHRSVSVEQKFADLTFKAEGFYNNFWDIVEEDSYNGSDGDPVSYYSNKGKLVTWGTEFLVKINNEEEQGLFGWASYAYNKSRIKTNQSVYFYRDHNNIDHNWGSEWLNSEFDMTHVIKLVAGYTFYGNTISCKFQYNTAIPYTAITGSYLDTNFTSATRNVPIYGKPNTERLTPEYSLDIRYSHKTSYKWGYVSWYIETIGIISSKDEYYSWDYRYPYGNNNPRIRTYGGLSFIPNMGVETKF
jgi:hypothetical protein